MKAANTSKKKIPVLGGKHYFFAATSGGQAKELGGQLPPGLYVKRGPCEARPTHCIHVPVQISQVAGTAMERKV